MAAASESAATGKPGVATVRPGRARDAFVFAAGVAATVLGLLAWAPGRGRVQVAFPTPGPTDGPRTFYDDPDLSYAAVGSVGSRLAGWDAKRAEWLRSRRRRNARERVVMVSGQQPEPCPGDAGDHLMLRFLKNKLDYCRLHGIQLLYNRDTLHPAMTSYWAKIPIVRAAMLAHPEAEWVWWVDSDAVFTDMDLSLPLPEYHGRNLVVYGWPKQMEKKSWLGINAGVFLIRNCQWSLDFMDEWARMGPAYPEEHARWGKVLRHALSDMNSEEACDQSALNYLLHYHRDRLGEKVHIESNYFFNGYWEGIVDRLDGVAARYEAVERRAPELRRRHAEREHLRYAAARNAAVGRAVPGPAGGGVSGWRRPLITHFVGCQPCGGGRNPMYSRESCHDGMRRALGFADDQVLRTYGFRHADLLMDSLQPLPFDYPAVPVANRSNELD
ncbi:hypothetical protein U9M48_002502 [Paspalum notatum var. saurae]|uniref:Glycosyltransferase 6 n=1 Tax=Paspalum notatum var. saurae TaxID=547442 RepID=A0AAQ3PRG7_PASNO